MKKPFRSVCKSFEILDMVSKTLEDNFGVVEKIFALVNLLSNLHDSKSMFLTIKFSPFFYDSNFLILVSKIFLTVDSFL